MRIQVILGMSGAAVLMASCLTMSPAMAGLSNTSVHRETGSSACSDNLRNRARFVHDTDNLKAIDDCADGWGAESELLLQTGTYRLCYNGSGNGTTVTCNYNFAEGILGEILARSVDNGDFRGSGDVKPIIT
ncbi:hypothetical protein NODU109028_01820 [Nocardioides dubius]|uniref:Uncharacterized protein n=1 Tax=Nocardioides dubius TaxID=317019 RepID=A0ABP4EF81_9ACTN